MSRSRRVASLVGSVLLLSACGSGPSGPSAPTAVRPSAAIGIGATATPVGDPYVESSSTAPEGFLPKFRVDPNPGEDGVIRGDASLQVEFDLCGSSNTDGKTHFLFDWNFDHVADVIGTDSACKQTHTYRVPAADDGQEKTLRTNVCVTSGDPRSADAFFSCRQYTIGLTAPRQTAAGTVVCGVFFGGGYTECVDVQARILRQDSGNDGSFETAFHISTDTTVGNNGACAQYNGAVYNGEIVDYQFSEPNFYAFMLGLGFHPHNDFCLIL